MISLLLVFITALTGCSLNGKYDSSLSIGEQIKTRHYNHNAKDFGKEQLLDHHKTGKYSYFQSTNRNCLYPE